MIPIIKLANQKDLTAVKAFLSANRLPVSDLTEENVTIYTLHLQEELVATIGLEKHGSTGLLRSLAVRKKFRNRKLADKMIRSFFAICNSEDITDVYLLTTTADRYFEKQGFQRVNRSNVPHFIQQTREFKSICPASAVVMHRQVHNKKNKEGL